MKVKRAPLDSIKWFISRVRLRGVFNFLVEDVRMRWYVVFFVAVVFIFGCLYTYFTPCGHGIGQNLEPLSEVTFLQGIYFSIITVSSLGYGDMHPMGYSKALACIEVLMGLAMIGIMIAKVTSRSMSYRVSRLFSSDAQKRLEDIAAKFDALQNDFDKIMPLLVAVYQSAPGQTSPPTGDRGALISDFREVTSDLKMKCIELHGYLLDEIEQDNNYFQIAPASAMVRVGEVVNDTFFRLAQHIIGLPTQVRTDILDGRNRQGITEAIEAQRSVCGLVDQHATDPNTQAVFQHIEETCGQVPASYFAVPEELQPDQVLQGTDEPQELSEVDNEHTDSP